MEEFFVRGGSAIAITIDPMESGAREDVSKPEVLGVALAANAPISGVVIGALAAFTHSGIPLVNFGVNSKGCPIAARSTVTVSAEDTGRQVALMFENGNPLCPILIGFIHTAEDTAMAKQTIRVNDERVTITAAKELVLTCGQASITLTRAGKILIRGAYLLSRSSGANRIRGGTVEIN